MKDDVLGFEAIKIQAQIELVIQDLALREAQEGKWRFCWPDTSATAGASPSDASISS